MSIFNFLKGLIETQDGLILFLLACIVWAMVFDLVLGTIAAKEHPEIAFTSQRGINGILRKITSILLMVFFIPLSILLPDEAGMAFLYTTYVGYLVFELTSIMENFDKLGINVMGLRILINKFITIKEEDK